MATIYTLTAGDISAMNDADVKLFYTNMFGSYVEAAQGYTIETGKTLVIASNNELKLDTENVTGSSYTVLNAFFNLDASDMFGQPHFLPRYQDTLTIQAGGDIDQDLSGFDYAVQFFTGSNGVNAGVNAGFIWLGDTGGGGDVENLKTLTSYLIDYEKLKDINRARFLYNSEKDLVTDLANNIINIMQLPLDLESLAGDEVNIILGGYTLQKAGVDLTAPELETTILTVDLGFIQIANNNAFTDYEGVKMFLMLPYYGELEIPLEAGYKGVSIEYRINLATGSTVIILSYDDEVYNSLAVDLGAKVPISTILGDASYSLTAINGGGFNGIYKPFIRVETLEVLESLEDRAVLPDNGVLSTFSGFIQVDSLDLTSLNKSDYENVLDLLNKGVYL